jgi:Xaa-Pro aminopeptidase
MFQNFDISGGPAHVKTRVAALRRLFKKRRLTGFIVPHADAHQSEYLPANAERLAWISGFSGSAGTAIVLEKKAAIFVDGRYTLQVRDQTDISVFTPQSLIDTPPARWLEAQLNSGGRIGYDPRLHTVRGVEALEQACKNANARLVAVDGNLIDQIWIDRPAAPAGRVARQPLRHAGVSAEAKLETVRKKLGGAKCDALVLTLPDSICWLFNIRGSDIAHNPVVLCHATVPRRGKPSLFIDAVKLTPAVKNYLDKFCRIRSPETFAKALNDLGAGHKRTQLDPSTASAWIKSAIGDGTPKAEIHTAPDPIIALKAIKNTAEIKGTRAAHERDGVAMCRFLAWLDKEASSGKVDEISAAIKLEKCRRETGQLKDISFDTISGTGPNGAIVHYRVSHESNRKLKRNSLYLVDSGGQYTDGTTDITRTVAIGKPSAEMRDRFTRVLKGHIAIARARIPEGTTGTQIDVLARNPLWEVGLDYGHGTGHGVGAYLSVHEGPQGISKRANTPLKPGMIVSNEPGYYKAGAYGIRIENLVLVIKDPQPCDQSPMLAFETLTLTPIDLTLIDRKMLGDDETTWLNAYHKRVFDCLSPALNKTEKAWLKAATASI